MVMSSSALRVRSSTPRNAKGTGVMMHRLWGCRDSERHGFVCTISVDHTLCRDSPKSLNRVQNNRRIVHIPVLECLHFHLLDKLQI